MNDIFIILIVGASLITSIWEYRKLLIAADSYNSMEGLYKMVGESALIDFISNMNDDEFKSFCLRFFNALGYSIKTLDDYMITLRNSRKTVYASCIRIDKDEKVSMEQVMQLYGFMCRDNIINGIVITSSIFNDKTYNTCVKLGINPIDIYDILEGLKHSNEQTVHELLPELN